ncbi:MAG: class II fumarate hydratase [Congregibacter sp.]
MNQTYRLEKDSLGQVKIPIDALYGPQTQRAVENFDIAARPVPALLICAIAAIKGEAAATNARLGLLDAAKARAIQQAADTISGGGHSEQFPVDLYQTGSGTSSNMNVNEVIAQLAGDGVHPNDDVNLCQSSNDVIPSALRVAVCQEAQALLEALTHLEESLKHKSHASKDVVKTGRTHLMDAMPVRMDQELGAWAAQIAAARRDIEGGLEALFALPLGGTAVGTGINAHADFAAGVCVGLARRTGIAFQAQSGFRNLGSVDAEVAFSGRLNTLATALLKICNDLRWMNSGPLCGLGEVQLPALQPGSSIMPGKVNPVIPEAAAMACIQVSGLHLAVTLAGQSGNFQLNVMLPLVADNILQSVALLQRAAQAIADKVIEGMMFNHEALRQRVAQNPVLVTALNSRIGYELGATIAKEAVKSGRAVIDVALEHTELSREELERLLDPAALTRGGIPGSDE